jgi:lysozyme family protein
MASFLEAYNITRKIEGGYANDPDDPGGETYRGISRRYNKSWPGWRIVDSNRSKPGFPNILYNNTELDRLVKFFFKDKYWDKNLLDELSSQQIANEMFDTGVNLGVVEAAKFLQEALNVLNKNGKIYSDIVEDGHVGSNTIDAFKACLAYKGEAYLYKVMNVMQGYYYIRRMRLSPSQEKYAYGWLDRVNFIKN